MSAVVREDLIGGARATTLQSGLAAGATALTVATGGLTTWDPVVHGRIAVVINRGEADEEHLYATAVAGDTLTGLVRGQDGTVDQAHQAGATVEHGLFAKHIDVSNEFLSLPTAAGQYPVSTAADTWGVASTLEGPTINDPVIGATEWGSAQHTHSGPSSAGLLAGGTPTNSAPGDAAAVGTAGAYATSGHVHGRESAGLVGDIAASAPSDTAAAGALAKIAKADHRHAREAWAATATTSLPTHTVSPGTAPRVAREDHRHGREGFAAPGVSAGGDVIAEGTDTTVSRSDHRHGREFVVKPAVDATNYDVVRGITPFTLTAATSVSVSVTWTGGFIYADVPVVTYGWLQGASIRVVVEMTAVSTTGATFLVYRPDGTATTASGSIHWRAEGT